MPKKMTASQKTLTPDPRFNSILVSKVINNIMERGKKTVAREIVYKAMDVLAKRVKDKEPLELFETAISNIKPNVEVKSKRVGGATYQVPVRVEAKRQQALAIRWILEAAAKKKGKCMGEKLADELTAAYKKEGVAWTTRENVHKMAEANRAFAHFAR